ncbi:MAG: type II toxin-antitoxin system RelE/ParE family toxin [Lautropia sp.]|nr:type II toxin-antitoxin system RelE/ParE family toxin [Lautropia sp.]
MAIKSFRCPHTRSLYEGKRVIRWVLIEKAALRKLAMLNAASRIEDLRLPPSNRLEALRGNRQGQYSIRINNQWRLCFNWHGSDAENVEIVDYH